MWATQANRQLPFAVESLPGEWYLWEGLWSWDLPHYTQWRREQEHTMYIYIYTYLHNNRLQ